MPGDPLRRVVVDGGPIDVLDHDVDDVETVLRDGETFSSSINAEHIGQYMGELILAMDGKEHRAYRNLVAHAFRASAARAVGRPARAARRSTRLLDEIAPAGKGDLVVDITRSIRCR